MATKIHCRFHSKLIMLLMVCLSVSSLYARNLPNRRSGTEGSLSIGIGAAHLFGDVGNTARVPLFGITGLEIDHVDLWLSGGFRHYLTNLLGYRIAFQHGTFTGCDYGSPNYKRAHAFEATISQIAFQMEYNFLRIDNFWLYGFAGGGVVHSKSSFEGMLKRLKDSYRDEVTAPFALLGIGIETRLTNRSTIGLEIGVNYYLSNYIDGISTPYSRNNDAIGFAMITFSHSIFGQRRINNGRCTICHWYK